MDASQVEQSLEAAEAALTEDGTLGSSGFWRTVSAVKQDPALVEIYADRIARIDRAAFRSWALIAVPLWLGNVLMVGATLIGLVLVGWAYSLDGMGAVIAFYVGFGVVLTTTHGLGHLVYGRLIGIRFSHWFIGAIRQPQPGVKIDYATYLRAPARSRAWMHAAGAIVTKLMPFLFVGASLAADLPAWAVWLLVLIGVGQLATDALWSTKSSDWMKFRREMALAQPSP